MHRLGIHMTVTLLLFMSSRFAYADTRPYGNIELPSTVQLPPRPNKAEVFFYRASEWMDHYLMKDVDTNYICLPEHSWRLAFTGGMVGVNSTFTAHNVEYGYLPLGDISFIMRTRPSVSLGFNAGYRGFGFGYSWDVMNAYSQNWNFSFGSKSIGLDFMRQTSNNIHCAIKMSTLEGGPVDIPDSLKLASITHTSFNVWYALNAVHYNHNAAIKQSYIQRKTAGSLLLQVNYMSSNVRINKDWAILTDEVVGIETHQMGVGIGYGINVTPNHGKVLFHLSGLAQLVCISQNLITHRDKVVVGVGGKDTTIILEGLYQVQSRYPVHVTGTVRAAVSWEINRWVHLNAWAKANNIRFSSQVANSDLSLTNWNWQVNMNVAVRLGAGYERRHKVLDAEEAYLLAEEREILRKARQKRADSTLVAMAEDIRTTHAYADSISAAQIQEAREEAKQLTTQSAVRKRKLRHTPLPKWCTDFFFSPRP